MAQLEVIIEIKQDIWNFKKNYGIKKNGAAGD